MNCQKFSDIDLGFHDFVNPGWPVEGNELVKQLSSFRLRHVRFKLLRKNQSPSRNSNLVKQSQLKKPRFQTSKPCRVCQGGMQVWRQTDIPEFYYHRLLIHDFANHQIVEHYLQALLVDADCTEDLVGRHAAFFGYQLDEIIERG